MKKKSFIMLVCAVLVVSSVAFGTIAYLTDRASVTNTFTVGNVDIKVDETVVGPDGQPTTNPDGTPTGERTEAGNAYHLLPGGVYTKDPRMTVAANSEEAYVRMLVTISSAAELDAVFAELQALYPAEFANGFFLPEEHVVGWDSEKWPCAGMTRDAVANTLTLEFRYADKVPSAVTDTELPVLFEQIKVPVQITAAQLQTLRDLQIEVVGQAIQTSGFADAAEAWAAFDAQYTVTATPQP